MICELCHGLNIDIERGGSLPCPDCNGFGYTYCCEGENVDTADERDHNDQN